MLPEVSNGQKGATGLGAGECTGGCTDGLGVHVLSPDIGEGTVDPTDEEGDWLFDFVSSKL